MSFLSKFSKKDQCLLDFAPELNIFHIQGNTNQETYITIRICSGDENNQNKNIKYPSNNIASISLDLDFKDNTYNENSKLNQQLVLATAKLKLDFLDNTDTKYLDLTEHKILITPSISKKGGVIEYPPKDEIEKEINLIWQDEFAFALQEYNDVINGTESSSKRPTKGKKSKFDKVITVGSIVVIIVSLGFVLSNKIFKSNNSQTIVNTINPNKIIQDAQVGMIQQPSTEDQIIDKPATSLEDEVLSEFGIESGISLDK